MIKQRDEDENLIDILLSGTSATLIVQNERQFYASWVGDSMFTICTTNNLPKQQCSEAMPHIATSKKEKFRIFRNKGEIRETDDMCRRVFRRGRAYPGLKTTRSIGDLLAHQIGVTSEPDFTSFKTSASDKYLVVGVDCLWEHFTPQ